MPASGYHNESDALLSQRAPHDYFEMMMIIIIIMTTRVISYQKHEAHTHTHTPLLSLLNFLLMVLEIKGSHTQCLRGFFVVDVSDFRLKISCNHHFICFCLQRIIIIMMILFSIFVLIKCTRHTLCSVVPHELSGFR